MDDIKGRKSQEVRRNFSIQLKNWFAALATLEDAADQDSVECSWNRIKDSYADTTKKTVGFLRKKTKKWLNKIKSRRKSKVNMLKC